MTVLRRFNSFCQKGRRSALRGLAVISAVLMLLSACSGGDVPFPYLPNLPDDFNRQTTYADLFQGPVALFTQRTLNEYSDGIVSQTVAGFDAEGKCVDYYYRDRETQRHLHFDYDSLGRRIREQCWQDTVGVELDTLGPVHTLTTYSYSWHGRRCKARLTGPDGKRHTFRLHYDRQGHLSRFIYPDGSRFSYDYDDAGHLVRRTWPDASFERFQYDSTGSLVSTTGRDGVIVWHLHLPPPTRVDSLGRVVEQVVGNSGTDSHDPIRAFYEYDDHCNWVRCTTASLSSPTRIDIRTFQYYNH